MTAKEYLKQAFHIDRRINDKLEQISSMRDLATKATSIINDMPGSATHDPHSMQEVIAKIIDDEEEVNAAIDRLVDLKAEIMRVIKAVASPEHQTLLELRYLCFKPWKVIADRMGYNVRHVYRLHDEAVESITIP